MVEARARLSEFAYGEISGWLDLARRELDALADCIASHRPESLR
jgi:hypothetical protein